MIGLLSLCNATPSSGEDPLRRERKGGPHRSLFLHGPLVSELEGSSLVPAIVLLRLSGRESVLVTMSRRLFVFVQLDCLCLQLDQYVFCRCSCLL